MRKRHSSRHYPSVLALGSIEWKMLKGLEARRTPASDFLFALFEKEVTDAALDPTEAEDLFDRLEFLISLEFAHLRLERMASNSGLWFWIPIGRYSWKREGILGRLTDYDNLPQGHPLLRAGLMGGTPASAANAVEAIRNFVTENPSLRW